jgi:VCBS repeat-containing protein
MATMSDSNLIEGTSSNENINGGADSDIIDGNAGNDKISAGSGNDTLDGGAGSDTLKGDSGDDVAIYVAAENTTGSVSFTDIYDGGSGKDTLKLVLTRAEWMSGTLQTDLENYQQFLSANTNTVNLEATNAEFRFTAFDLRVSKFEKLEITVDGVAVNPVDAAVTLAADSTTSSENGASIALNVLANDQIPDLIAAISFTQAAHGTVTLQTLALSDPAQPPRAEFVYTTTAGYWDYLANGQTATDSFIYTVTDADGDVSSQMVTVTIAGTNDAPTIVAATTTATGAVTEIADNAAGENANILTATGTVGFADVDVLDTHTATATALGSGYLGTLTLASVDQGANSVGWNFSVGDAALDSLAAGEIRTQSYTVAVSDGQGGTASQTVTLTITGTNDAPTIVADTTTPTGAVTEIADNAAGENTNSLTAAGAVAFADVDTIDTHSATVTPNASGYLGTLTLASVDQGANSVGWNFSVGDAALDSLAAGEIRTQSYTVAVSDGQGGTASQTVTLTITGTNDTPTIVAGTTTP